MLPAPRRTRPLLILALALVVALGLGDRLALGSLLSGNLGDALYAVAVGLAVLLVWPRIPPRWALLLTWGLCTAIEFFQLTGIPAALGAQHRLVTLLLGTTFSLGDLLAYTVGALALYGVDRVLFWSRALRYSSR